MKASYQWLMFAELLSKRAIEIKEKSKSVENNASMIAIAVCLIGASADATTVAGELLKEED